MTEYFREAKRRIARAKEHIDNLKTEIETFLDAHPYARIVEPHADGFNEAYKIKLTSPVPDQLGDLTVEIAEGLRAALDKAGFAAAVASGNQRLKGTYFPIADSPEQLETDVIGRGRCKDLPPEILNLFRSFKPYKNGNFAVWAVNLIANGSKHRILNAVGIGVGGGAIRNFFNPGYTAILKFPPVWDSEHDEMLLFVVGRGSQVKYEFELAMTVALSPIDPGGHIPATEHLRIICGEVEKIVLATEAETARLLKEGRSGGA
jgi:hypothetical protein